jgi:hypothetical protein
MQTTSTTSAAAVETIRPRSSEERGGWMVGLMGTLAMTYLGVIFVLINYLG